jgi:hypothetical protein
MSADIARVVVVERKTTTRNKILPRKADFSIVRAQLVSSGYGTMSAVNSLSSYQKCLAARTHASLLQSSKFCTIGFLPPLVIIHTTSSSVSLTSWCSANAGMSAKSPGASSSRFEPLGPLTMAPWPLAAYTIVSGRLSDLYTRTWAARGMGSRQAELHKVGSYPLHRGDEQPMLCEASPPLLPSVRFRA